MERVDQNDSIFTFLPSLHFSNWIFRTLVYLSAEARPRPSQASKINFFMRIDHVFKLTLLTIYTKNVPPWMSEGPA